jgi:hypothetical protein
MTHPYSTEPFWLFDLNSNAHYSFFCATPSFSMLYTTGEGLITSTFTGGVIV